MKKIYIFAVLSLSIFPAISSAQVYINEIMYDLSGSDSGREWVEIYNSSPDAIDISTWKFLESSTASNHSINQVQGEVNIPAGGFAVISIDPTKFLLDWPAYSGSLFKSAFSSLNNTGGTVYLKDKELTVQDQVPYNSGQGAGSDGNSLQRTASGWVSAAPTPGIANSTEPAPISSETVNATTETESENSDTSTESTSSGNMSAHSSPASLSNTSEKIEFEISAGRNRLTTVGNSLVFQATPTKLQNVNEQGITYEWSFGDGTIGQGKILNHIYKFAGEYSVVVNAMSSDKQAVSRSIVKVIYPEVSLMRVSGGGTEIWNKSNVEINLEGWNLVGNNKSFIFPKDTLVGANKKVIFGDSVTGISNDSIQLSNPIGQLIAKISGLPLTSDTAGPASNPANLDDIQAKIESVKNAITQISQEQIVGRFSAETITHEPSEYLEPTIVVSQENEGEFDQEIKTEIQKENINQVASVVESFEAPQKTGIVSTIFAWPIKGFNFIRRLFVEE